MIETSKELQENERRRRSLAGGRVVVSPTLPAPPARFPPFRFVSNLEWRFYPRVSRHARVRRRRGKENGDRGLSSPCPGRFRPVDSITRTCGLPGRRGNAEMISRFCSTFFRALLRFRDHFFFPARSFVVEGVNFFRGWTRLAAARGDLLRRYRVRRDGVSEVEAMAGDRFRPPPPPPSTPSWRGNTSTESTDDGLQTRRE